MYRPLQCIRLFAIDAEKYLVVQILALHYSVTKKLILATTLIGKKLMVNIIVPIVMM